MVTTSPFAYGATVVTVDDGWESGVLLVRGERPNEPATRELLTDVVDGMFTVIKVDGSTNEVLRVATLNRVDADAWCASGTVHGAGLLWDDEHVRSAA